jgi:hypothetical protein
VSGLNAGSGKVGPSFPQPEDISGDAQNETEGEVEPSGAKPVADLIPRASNPDEDVPQSKGTRKENDEDAIIDVATPLEESSGDTPDRTEDAQVESSGKFGLSVPNDEELENTPGLTSAKRSASTERNLSLQESNLRVVSSTLSERPGPATSKTSLLRQDSPKPIQEDPPQQPSSSSNGLISRVARAASRSQGSNLDNPTAQGDDDEPTLGKRIRSHIRFDPSEEGARSALLVRARMAQVQLGTKAKDTFRRDFKDGQILKMEKMLVRIDSTPEVKLPDDYDENGSQGIVSKTQQKWREYMVVCRQCQKDENDSADFVLQIYKSRVSFSF